jgi:hypothetical protein
MSHALHQLDYEIDSNVQLMFERLMEVVVEGHWAQLRRSDIPSLGNPVDNSNLVLGGDIDLYEMGKAAGHHANCSELAVQWVQSWQEQKSLKKVSA